MRVTLAKLMTAVVIILNFIVVYFIWRLVATRSKIKLNYRSGSFTNELVDVRHIGLHQSKGDGVTFILRSFEAFEHDIEETIKSVLTVFPNATIMVVSDYPVYPPILLNTTTTGTSDIKFINLKTDLSKSFKDRIPTLQVKSKYILFIPDSTRLSSRKLIDSLVKISEKEPGKIIAIPFKGSKKVQCLQLHLEIREWMLRFDEFPHAKECGFIKGKHALFIELENVFKVSDPFILPFPDSLYLQFASHNIKVGLREFIIIQVKYWYLHSRLLYQMVEYNLRPTKPLE